MMGLVTELIVAEEPFRKVNWTSALSLGLPWFRPCSQKLRLASRVPPSTCPGVIPETRMETVCASESETPEWPKKSKLPVCGLIPRSNVPLSTAGTPGPVDAQPVRSPVSAPWFVKRLPVITPPSSARGVRPMSNTPARYLKFIIFPPVHLYAQGKCESGH